MTTLRTAAQQALEAMEKATRFMSDSDYKKLNQAIEDLRAALAEPAQEPVAWRWGYRSVTTGEMDWRGYVEIATDPKLRSPAIMEPLYTAPPQRKPLTEAQIYAAIKGIDSLKAVEVARAIEKAHGIE